MFQTKVVEKIKTRFSFQVFFFSRKSCHLWDNVWKYDIGSRRGHRWQINTAHALSMLDY